MTNSTAQINSRDEIDLLSIAKLLYNRKWLIISFALLGLLLAGTYALGKRDVYRADLLIQVESSDSNLSSFGGLDMFAAPPKINVEKQILLSRAVLSKVIKQLALEIEATPQYLPLPVRALQFFNESAFGLAPWLYSRGYADADAKIQISEFQTPAQFAGQKFNLLIADNNFTLEHSGQVLLTGAIGKAVSAAGFSIFINSASVNHPSKFKLRRLNYLKLIEHLQTHMHASNAKNTDGVLQLDYSSTDAEYAKRLIDSTANEYINRNIEHSGAEVAGSLNFLKIKLPEAKRNLEQAEQELNDFRIKHGSLDVSAEAQALLDQVVEVEKALSDLRLRRSEIKRQFTRQHPSYRAWQQQSVELDRRRALLLKRIESLPKTQQDVVRLTRGVKVGSQIYLEMLNRIQALDVALAGTVGNVFLLDKAAAFLQPRNGLVIILAGIFLSTLLCCALIVLRYLLRRGISNDEQLQQLGLSVYAVLPYSKEQGKRIFDRKKIMQPLALSHPHDEATEAVRSLRTSLHFALLEAKNNIISITGAEPGVGKSFVSTNLAILLAQTEAKVLLIDADMRRGRMHYSFGLDNSEGFASILAKKISAEQAINHQVGGIAGFDVICRGQMPPNPTELLMGKDFAKLLASFSASYDFVIIDTPPVLAVADAVIIGEHAGTNMLVVRAEQTTVPEVRFAQSRFSNAGLQLKGAVLNAFNHKTTGYGYSYHYAYGAEH